MSSRYSWGTNVNGWSDAANAAIAAGAKHLLGYVDRLSLRYFIC